MDINFLFDDELISIAIGYTITKRFKELRTLAKEKPVVLLPVMQTLNYLINGGESVSPSDACHIVELITKEDILSIPSELFKHYPYYRSNIYESFDWYDALCKREAE